MNPIYPVYVISKGRFRLRQTSKALEHIKVPYNIVIEPQEYDDYSAVIDPKKILVLPFSNLGQGSIPARNWVWNHSMGIGAEKHWIIDDNISMFERFNNNKKIKVSSGTIFRCAEHFTDRYENVALSGLNYRFFVPAHEKKAPYTQNTRIYSCILIRNDIPFRWRGRYNEDTDLSIRVLKAGWCTILFNAFLCNKETTMKQAGGNNIELYKGDGRLKMAESLVEQHPDVATVSWKFGRWQHHVDYRPFENNKLIRKKNLNIKNEVDNFGMILAEV